MIALVALLMNTPVLPPPLPTFSVRNDTGAAVRCLVTEGGPITQMVTIKPGATRVEQLAVGARVSLACPKLRDTTFGPVGPGRYVLRRVKGRPELSPLP